MQKKWELHSEKGIKGTSNVEKELIELLLTNRDIISEKERETFLHPRLDDVTIENVGINAQAVEKACKRLRKAKEKGEMVIVYGDYDVDGITGSAILWETLNEIGIKARPYIPHRIDEGYGLSEKGIDNLLRQYPDVSLIITVDNGIVANAAVMKATEKGIETVITDHHVADEENRVLPKAYAIVHTTKLCGAGIAWLLSQEFRKYFDVFDPEKEDIHLELATLGTVADLVPLTGANRAIVYHGLEKLCLTSRSGLRALYDQAALPANDISVYHIGHVIGPRLNATGRLESAMDSLRLLCTKDKNRAIELAQKLGVINLERQKIMADAASHAMMTVRQWEELKKILIIDHESYPEGVIGLVAGKLVEEFYRPAIVISRGEKTSKGSVRSVKGFNIIKFLRSNSELFVNLGGHPMAAGFTIETARIEEFRTILEELANQQIDDLMLQRSLSIDAPLSLNAISPNLYAAIQRLSPFGMGNPEPTFVSSHVLVREKRIIGKDKKHLRLVVQQDDDGKIFEAVAFGMADRAGEFDVDDYIDIVYTIDENTWQGQMKLQLKIKDFAHA